MNARRRELYIEKSKKRNKIFEEQKRKRHEKEEKLMDIEARLREKKWHCRRSKKNSHWQQRR